MSGLPNTRKGNDAIWDIVDRLTNSAHFLPFKTGLGMEKMANLYIVEVVRLHGAPVSISVQIETTSSFRCFGLHLKQHWALH